MSNHYTYRAEWSPEDNEYVGLVAEFPSLSWLAPTAAEAVEGASRLVDDILADMKDTGETPPTPLTERRYSGNLSVRTSPDQHRRLAIEAAEQGVSVNHWINHKLGASVVNAYNREVANQTAVMRESLSQLMPKIPDLKGKVLSVTPPGEHDRVVVIVANSMLDSAARID